MCQKLKPSSPGSLNEEHGGPRPANVTSCWRASGGIKSSIESIDLIASNKKLGVALMTYRQVKTQLLFSKTTSHRNTSYQTKLGEKV